MRASNIQGHPQCLRNTTTVGLPSATGNRSFADEGARVPITGGPASSIGGGGGVAHECHDFGTERFANGFANGAGAFGSFRPDEVSGKERAFEGIPALRSAIFVVSLENILKIVQIKMKSSRK